jgi:hypothetical protein
MQNTLHKQMNDQLEAVKPPVDVDQLDTAKPLVEIFQPYQTTLEKWSAKVKSLVVTDITQKTEMAQARLARLEIKDARVAMEKTRVGLVEKLKQRTGKIDAMARGYRIKMESLEEELRQSEEFAIRHAAKLKAELKTVREARLKLVAEGPILGDLSDLSEEAFSQMLDDAKLLKQAKIDADNKAEAERRAKEEADRAERARVAAENARLKAEAEERAKEMEAERKRVQAERAEEAQKAEIERKRIEAERAEELRKTKEEADLLAAIVRKEHEEAMTKVMTERRAIEAKAKAEAAAAAKARAELAAKAKAEAEEKARIEKAKREAELAPDRDKLVRFAVVLRHLEIPTLKLLDLDLAAKVEEWAMWVEAQIKG